jgi:hypothetical protein
MLFHIDTRGLYYKTFIAVINSISLYVRLSDSVSHFHPSLIFTGKAGAYTSGAPYGTPLKGRLLPPPPNIKRGWKWLSVTNNVTYYNTDLIMAAKVLKLKPQGQSR